MIVTGVEYRVIWVDDTQSYTGYEVDSIVTVTFQTLFQDKYKIPIHLPTLKKVTPELYKEIKEIIINNNRSYDPQLEMLVP